MLHTIFSILSDLFAWFAFCFCSHQLTYLRYFLLGTTGKRDSFHLEQNVAVCSSSDNSTCSVCVRGICESINDAVVTVGCVSNISSVNLAIHFDEKLWKCFKISLGKISSVETLSKVKNSTILEKAQS